MSTSKRLFRGAKVHDATRATSITIVKRDLALGAEREPNYCVIAHAFKREQKKEAVVHTTKIYVRDGNHWTRYPVPHRLRTEIVVFDRHGEFAEGEYELKPPAPAQRLDYRPPRQKKPSQKKQGYHRTPGIRGQAHYDEDGAPAKPGSKGKRT